MRKSLEQFEMLDKYLLGELTGREKEIIEGQLETDSELREQLKFQKEMITAVRRKALRSEIASAGSSGSFGKGWIVSILIAIIVTAAIAGFLMKNSRGEAEEEKTTGTLARTTTGLKSENFTDRQKPVAGNAVQLMTADAKVDDIGDLAFVNPAINNAQPVMFESFGNSTTLKPWLPFEKQLFRFSNRNGAAIEGKGGTLVIVPENGFIDENNNIVNGDVSLELIEALSMTDIIRYNLTTVSGKDVLSSGGMLHIAARSNGKEVKVNPERPLYIEIPTANPNPHMMAWKGEEKNGEVDWTNPQPLNKYLARVDFVNLDFVPEGFEEEVQWHLPFRQYKAVSKKLSDSLYYALGKATGNVSFAAGKGGLRVNDIEGNGVEGLKVSFYKNKKIAYTFYTNTNGIASPVNSGAYSVTVQNSGSLLSTINSIEIPSGGLANCEVDMLVGSKARCCIDPAAVKTVRTENFANTFLATKEFEQRIQLLHKLKNGNKMFEIYVNNLTKDLWEVDAMVAAKLTGNNQQVFRELSAEKLTNVKDAPLYQDKLSDFYNRKRREIGKEEQEKYNDYWENTKELIASVQKEIAEVKNHSQLSGLSSAGNSIGRQTFSSSYIASAATPAVGKSYSTSWYTTGWVNIDCYLHSIEKDPENVAINANQQGDYRVYQCINMLNTMVGLNPGKNGQYEAKFPAKGSSESKQMENTYCLGIKRSDDSFLLAYSPYNPYEVKEAVPLKWESISVGGLQARLQSISGANDMLIADLRKEEERLKNIALAKAEIARLERELKSVSLEMNQEQKMMKELEDFIDQCRSGGSGGNFMGIPSSPVPMPQSESKNIDL